MAPQPHHAEDAAIAREEAPEIPYVNWRKDPGLRKLYFYAAIICVASATTGYDGSLLDKSQNMDLWQEYFDHPVGANMGRLQAMYQIGSIASLPIAPIISDRFGRKVSIIIGCILMITAGGLQTAATGQPMFEGARFFLGFGNSLAQLASPLLLTEICHPQHRARVTAIYNCLWHVGHIICAWLTFGTMRINNSWCWRGPTLVQSVFSIIQLCAIWWVPESPRWLIAKDRHDDALQILAKYHANGNENDVTVQFEYAEIRETLRLEFLYKKTSSYFDFFKTEGNRYRLGLIISLGVFSQMSGNALTSYYSNRIYDSVGIDDNDTRFGLNGGRSILDLIVTVSCALLVDRIGRRPLFLAATGGMLLFFAGMTVLGNRYTATPTTGIGIGFVTFQWLHGVSYALAWSGLLVAYTVEILPFKLRAKGLMIMNVSVQAALAFSGQVNPIPIDGAWNGQEWKLYTVYTCWIAFELVIVYMFYVETRGPTLEEIAKIFDGKNAEVANIMTDIAGLSAVRTNSNDIGITEIHVTGGTNNFHKNTPSEATATTAGTFGQRGYHAATYGQEGSSGNGGSGGGGYDGQYGHGKDLSGSSDGFGGRYHAR